MESTRKFLNLLKIYPELRKTVGESKDVTPAPPEFQQGLTEFLNTPEMTVFYDAMDYLDVPRTRNFVHLKLLEYDQHGNLDLNKMLKILRDAFNPGKLKIFSTLDAKGRYLLKSFTPDQIDYLSNYTRLGLRFYSRYANWTSRQISIITSFDVEEIWILSQMPRDRIFNLYRMEENGRIGNVGDEEEPEDWLGDLNDQELSILRKIVAFQQNDYILLRQLLTDSESDFYSDAIFILENRRLISQEEMEIFEMSNEEKKDYLKNLSPEERDTVNPNVLKIANRLSQAELDSILNLRPEQIDAITDLDGQRRITHILQEIPADFQGPIKPVHQLSHEEELLIWKFSSRQRFVLSKLDHIHLVRELNDRQLDRLLDRLLTDDPGTDWNLVQRIVIDEFRSLNATVQEELKTLPRQIWKELCGLLRDHRTGRAIGNLSVGGKLVLKAMTRLTDDHLITVNRSSLRGLMVLVENNWLQGEAIDRLEHLFGRDRKYLINLTLYERIMSRKVETSTLIRLKRDHPDLVGSVIGLSQTEITRFVVLNGRIKATVFQSNQIEFDTVAALREIGAPILLDLFDEFRRIGNALSFWPILLRPEKIVEYLFNNIPRILWSLYEDLISQLSMTKLLAELITGLLTDIPEGLSLISYIAEKLETLKLVCGFYLNLYHYAEIGHPYSVIAISGLEKSLYDFRDLGLNYNLRDETDVRFFKSLLRVGTPEVVSRVLRTVLPELARTAGDCLERIFHAEEIGGILGRDFELAKGMLLGNSIAVSRLIAKVLGKDRCLSMLRSEIDHRVVAEFPRVFKEAFIAMFRRPNFFKFCVFYRWGKIEPLIEGLGEERMKILLGKNREKMIGLMTENGFDLEKCF